MNGRMFWRIGLPHFHSAGKRRYFPRGLREEFSSMPILPRTPTMPNLPWLSPVLERASGWLSEVSNLADLAQGSTLNLAVTGLSRSGKTVFITSLIHNLLSAVHTPDRMPLL